MADVVFAGVGKVYPDGTRAVLDLNLAIEDGEFLVLVGPSGCGKTTALRMLAGLEEITEGDILIGGTSVATAAPRDRDIAMVFQNYALYPHMTIFENIAFPLRSQRIPKAELQDRVRKVAKLLGLEDMLKRRPRTLSGGQRQRVAMGRAIVRDPKVFLMDEPLSNLDAKLRVQMRTEILGLQKSLGTTTLYVTHDQIEALTMGDRIAVMRKGVLQQLGKPQDLYDRPANLFVATFIGSPAMNLLHGTLERDGDEVVCVAGAQRLSIPRAVADELRPALNGRTSLDVAVGIRPEFIAEFAGSPADRPRLRGDVTLVETLGFDRLVHVTVPGEPVLTEDVLEIARDTDAAVVQTLQDEAGGNTVSMIARLGAHAGAAAGTTIELSVDPQGLHFFDLQSGDAIR
jgi:multiple sugar transport system ATP-binding protein